MLRLITLTVAVTVLCALAPRRSAAQEGAVRWERVVEQAAFRPRDSCGEAVFRDSLWIMGGWFDSYSEPPADVWSSSDGAEWTLATEKAPWKHSDLPTTLAFGDKLWIMGGWHNGRLPGASASNEVWASGDGARWEQVTAQAPWSPRLGAAGVVFQNKMFLLGGVERYYDGEARHLKNDVWCSEDGKSWRQLTASAPWQGRAYHAAAVLDDRLYLFGGGNYTPGYFALNDVWSSSDGVHWEQVTESAAWAPRIWFSGVVYRDRLWVLGGWSNNPFQNWNDVWHSSDGRNWTELKADNVWARRHEHSAYVFQDALWVVAGHAQPLQSDVWRLKLPANWKGEGN